MDSFELNKIMGAVLGTLLFVMGVGFLAEAIYHPIENRGPGYALPEPEPTEGGAAAEAEPEVPLGVLLASASADRGATAARKCQSCHNFGAGEPNKQGPALYGVVGRPEGSHEGFAYSDVLLAYNAEGRVWTYESLDHFLERPSDYAPGTKMNFSGVRSPEERADLLAYLQTLSDDPVPFPAADVAPAVAVEGAEPSEAEAGATPGDAGITSDPETTAPENVTEPTAPAGAVETPEESQSETPVVGTPTGSGNPATTQSPGTSGSPELTPPPANIDDPNTPAPAQ